MSFIPEKNRTITVPNVTQSTLEKIIDESKDENKVIHMLYVATTTFLHLPNKIRGIRLFPNNGLEINEIKIV